MKVLIIEDEAPAVNKLKKLLTELDEPIEILDCMESVSESAGWFSTHKEPDLIFMDIRLADGLSFEIFDLVSIKAPIIFTTAYNEYAIKAFKVNSIDYLLKPIAPEELRKAVDKYKQLFIDNHTQQNLQHSLKEILGQFSESYKNRFFIKVGQRYRTVPTSEIECFFIQDKSTFLMTSEGKTMAIDYSLDQLIEMVDPKVFFRVNRSFLININWIKDIIIYSGSRLKVKLNSEMQLDEIIVSREKVTPFKKWMES